LHCLKAIAFTEKYYRLIRPAREISALATRVLNDREKSRPACRSSAASSAIFLCHPRRKRQRGLGLSADVTPVLAKCSKSCLPIGSVSAGVDRRAEVHRMVRATDRATAHIKVSDQRSKGLEIMTESNLPADTR